MKKKIEVIIDTEEDNDKILNILKMYFSDSFKNPKKQLINIKVENIENEQKRSVSDMS